MRFPIAEFSALVALSIVAAFTAPDAHADWINLTGAESAPNIAEITIHEDRVHIALEVFVDDVGVFDPNSEGNGIEGTILAWATPPPSPLGQATCSERPLSPTLGWRRGR